MNIQLNNTDLNMARFNMLLKLDLFVKSFMEPYITDYFPNVNKGIYNLMITGGESLNYYLPANKQYLTHDFDMKIFTLPHIEEDNIPADLAFNQRNICDQFASLLNDVIAYTKNYYLSPNGQVQLNELERIFNQTHTVWGESNYFDFTFKDIFVDIFLDLEFFTHKVWGGVNGAGLYTVQYNLNNIDQMQLNTIDQRQRPVPITKYSSHSIIDIFPHYISKNMNSGISFSHHKKNQENITNPENALDPNDPNDNNKYLIKNIPEYWVEDEITKNNYIGLGDLFNDTARMIVWSAEKANKRGGTFDNNKLYKYVEKYANLITVLDDMIPNLTCRETQDINITICQNIDTNDNIDCDGTIKDPEQIKREKLEEIKKFLSPLINTDIDRYPNNKLCKIYRGLTENFLSGF